MKLKLWAERYCKLVVVMLVMNGVQLFGAPIPAFINYQGKLTDAQGLPLETAEYSLAFRIYDAPSGGTLKWGPQLFDGVQGRGHAARVPIVRGYFNVILGPSDLNGLSLATSFTEPNRWIEITVGSAAPILPRQQVLSTPFALTAGTGGGAVGDIVASVLNEAQFNEVHPGGVWVPCDGRDITNSRLYTLTSQNNVADLRGRVTLGRDDPSVNRVQDTAADIIGGTGGEDRHTLTLDEMPAHNHTQEVGRGDPFYYRPAAGGMRDSNEWHWGGATGSSGGGLPHNNMPPYLVVTYYCRIN